MPLSLTRRPFAAAAACVAIVYIALFWRLGEPSFWDPDEAHYAQTTREVLLSGDWLAPTYNGAPFYDKPIVFHWMQALSMLLLGQNEAAARLSGALCCAALALVTWWLGRRLADPQTGLIAGVLVAISPGAFGLARYAILDPSFTLCLFGGVSLIAVAMLERQPRLEWGGYLLIGAAAVTKGPIALVLCGAAFVVVALISGELRRRLFALHWVAGLVIAGSLALVWPLYMWRRFGDAFVDGWALNENLRLFAAPLYGNQPNWTFYVVDILLPGLLPWTGLILGRAYDQIRYRRDPAVAADLFDRLLWAWTIAVTGFFSLSQFKLDHYVFPVLPALCLLGARAWRAVALGRADAREGSALGARLVGPLLLIAGLAVGGLAILRLDLPWTFLAVPLAIVACGAALTIRRPAAFPVPWPGILAFVALYVGVIVFVLPKLEFGKTMPHLAGWLNEHAPAAKVGTFLLNRWNPAFRFYLQRPVTIIENEEELWWRLTDESPRFIVGTLDAYRKLEQAGARLEIVHQRDGVWATSGRLLWREKGVPTTFVIAEYHGPIAD